MSYVCRSAYSRASVCAGPRRAPFHSVLWLPDRSVRTKGPSLHSHTRSSTHGRQPTRVHQHLSDRPLRAKVPHRSEPARCSFPRLVNVRRLFVEAKVTNKRLCWLSVSVETSSRQSQVLTPGIHLVWSATVVRSTWSFQQTLPSFSTGETCKESSFTSAHWRCRTNSCADKRIGSGF